MEAGERCYVRLRKLFVPRDGNPEPKRTFGMSLLCRWSGHAAYYKDAGTCCQQIMK